MQRQNFYTAEDQFYSFKRGEEKAFNYFFHLYYKQLVHFAFTYVKHTETAEDLVEDSFVKLWEKRETIVSANGIKPYLFQTVRNTCINYLKRQSYNDAYINHVKQLPVETDNPGAKLIASETMRQVFLALQVLPDKYQKVFTMYYVEEKEIKDIAAELNLPVPTVRSQKVKVLELLRKRLQHLSCLLFL